MRANFGPRITYWDYFIKTLFDNLKAAIFFHGETLSSLKVICGTNNLLKLSEFHH